MTNTFAATAPTPPITMESIRETMRKFERINPQSIDPFAFGIPITLSEYLTETVWEFPEDKYVEYGPEDLWWAIPNKFGRWVTRPIGPFQVGNRFVIHPQMWEQLKVRVPPMVVAASV